MAAFGERGNRASTAVSAGRQQQKKAGHVRNARPMKAAGIIEPDNTGVITPRRLNDWNGIARTEHSSRPRR